MRAVEFLTYAEKAVNAGRPVDRRNAISRAYYGVFNTAVECLASVGKTLPRTADSHALCNRLLLQVQCDVDVQDAGSWLSDARGTRNDADYDLTNTAIENKATAQSFVVEARSHLNALSKAFGDSSVAAAIKADIAKYDQALKPTTTRT